MSLFSSFFGISKKSLSSTRWTANRPRRVCAWLVMTRPYGRGLGARAVAAPPAESPLRADVGSPVRTGDGGPDGVCRAQAEANTAVRTRANRIVIENVPV